MNQRMTNNMPDPFVNKQSTKHLKTGFLAVVCLVVLVILAIPLYKAYLDLQDNEASLKLAQAENQQAVENNRDIQIEYQRVNDPNYLEDIARRDYYYSKKGEIIFILPEEEVPVNQEELNQQ